MPLLVERFAPRLRVLSGSAFVVAITACGSGPTNPIDDPGQLDDPAPVGNIADFVGSWTVASTIYLPGGDSISESNFSSITSRVGGAAFREVFTGVSGDSLYGVEALMSRGSGSQWTMARADGVAGTMDVLGGPFSGGVGSFISLSGTRPDGGLTRVSISDGLADSFALDVAHSDDDGATWTAAVNHRYTRAASTPPTLPERSMCASVEHRGFDFWLGSWNAAGTGGGDTASDILSRLGGCILEENWNGTVRGTSYNMYDTRTQLWYQFWADSAGLDLVIQGAIDSPGALVLDGRSVGNGQLQRISWTGRLDGTVRQLGEVGDGQGGWTTSYDLIYSVR